MLDEFLLTIAVFFFLYMSATLVHNYITVLIVKRNTGTTRTDVLFAISGALLVLEIVQWL